MMDRQKGNIVFECDGCQDVLETGTADWGSAQNALKRARWSAVKVDEGDWEHYCDGAECRRTGGVS